MPDRGLGQDWLPASQDRDVLGRARSTITREVNRGRRDGRRYRAVIAQDRVDQNRRRAGRPAKLVVGSGLFEEVVERLGRRHSPEQIAGRLRRDFPDDAEMWVSHERIYQALYLRPRSELAKQVKDALRTGRARRKPQGWQSQPKLKGMIGIADRPVEAGDRAVPGHWEGDLILGAGCQSAIGTLVERVTGFLLLLHLPGDHTAATVADAMSGSAGSPSSCGGHWPGPGQRDGPAHQDHRKDWAGDLLLRSP